MAETPSQPPGWPFEEGVPAIPEPSQGTPGPAYEAPPSDYEPATYETSSGYEPDQQPPPPRVAHSTYKRQAPPPKQSWKPGRSFWKKFAIIAAVLAIPIGACTVWFIGTVKAPVDESNRFLAAIDSGDYQAAADMSVCFIEADVLQAFFQGADIEYDLKQSNVSNNTTATVSGSLSAPGQPWQTVSLALFGSDGDWGVCEIVVG